MAIKGVKPGRIGVGEVQAEVLKLMLELKMRCITPTTASRELRFRGLNVSKANTYQALLRLESRGVVRKAGRGVYCLEDGVVEFLPYLEFSVKHRKNVVAKLYKKGGE